MSLKPDEPDVLDANYGVENLCHTLVTSGSSSAPGCLEIAGDSVGNYGFSEYSEFENSTEEYCAFPLVIGEKAYLD